MVSNHLKRSGSSLNAAKTEFLVMKEGESVILSFIILGNQVALRVPKSIKYLGIYLNNN